MSFSAELGARIRRLREARAWSQRTLSMRSGISEDRLRKYESGAHEPPLQALMRLATAFGVPADALLPDVAGAVLAEEDARWLTCFHEVAALTPTEKEAFTGLCQLLLGFRSLVLLSAGKTPSPAKEARRHVPSGK
jgi:transcriptional regulator with XRE-family HTH domain